MIKIGKLVKLTALIILFSVLNLFVLTETVRAAESLKVEIKPESVGVGDQVYLYLTVQSNDDFKMEEPKIPMITGLQFLQAQNAGQSSSTHMNFINGKTEYNKSVQQQYVVVFEATQAGLVVVPSISVNVNGKVLKSGSQKISVAKTSQQKTVHQQKPAGRPQFDDPMNTDTDMNEDEDMFVQLMKQRQKMLQQLEQQMGGGSGNNFGRNAPAEQIPSRKLDINTNEAFFVLLESDKKNAYEGEQITANWYIYTRSEIESLDRAKFPDLKGFWKEIIEEVPSLQFQQELVNGIMYKKALLASHALFPIKAGVAVIDEFNIKAKVRMMTPFGWGQPNVFTKASRRSEIKVLPLPLENRPQSFSGAVGQFQIQTQIEGTQFPVGQPISLKIRFEGQGNAKLIELPRIDWPTDIEVYDTKSESKFFKNGQSYKEFEVLVIAKQQGDLKIPVIKFSYFDPVQKQYVTKSTDEISIKIIEPLKGAAESISTNSQKIASQNTPVPEIITPLPITEITSSLFSWTENKMTVLMSLTCMSLMILLVQFLLALRKIKMSPQLKIKVTHKIKILEKAVKKKDYKLFGAESLNLLYLITAQLAHETHGSQDWAALIHKMPENYRHKYEAKLSQLFDYFQMVGFAPDSVREQALSLNSPEQMYSELKSVAYKITAEVP